MKLTAQSLMDAILAARNLEDLQSELRTAMVEQLIEQSSSAVPVNTTLPGAPIQ